MIEEMMRKAMEESEKRKEASKPAYEALWSEKEGEAATDAAINCTFNAVGDYIFSLTDGGEKQVAAMKALRATCQATKDALKADLRNNKFPSASWFRKMVPLKDPNAEED